MRDGFRELGFDVDEGDHAMIPVHYFLKNRVPGFKNSFIYDSASQIGTRGSRRLVGEYVLTRDEIIEDIKGFKDRIRIAKERLEALPSTASIYKERRNIKDQRRKLQQEITHVRGLISMAEEALGEI